MGKVNAPIINAGIALVIQTVTAVVLLLFTNLDLYSIAIANTLYAAIMCGLNQWAVRKAVEYRQEVMTTFLVPALASLCMGGAAWAVYESLLMLTSAPHFISLHLFAIRTSRYPLGKPRNSSSEIPRSSRSIAK